MKLRGPLAALVLVGLVSIGSSFFPVPVILRQVTGWVSLTVLPGVVVSLFLRRRIPAVEFYCLASGLGLPLSGGTALLLYRAGLDLNGAVVMTIALFLLPAAGRIFSPLGREVSPEVSPHSRSLLLFSVLAMVSVAILPATSYWWRVRSDAWFHGAVTFQILRSGAPPLDPYFAGLKLNYMWFYHFFLAAVNRLTGLSPFWSMFLLNVQYLFCLVMAVYAIATRLGAGWRAALLSTGIAVFGLNGLFWLFWPLKLLFALTGEVKGVGELHRMLGGGILGITQVRKQLSVLGSVPFFLDKYMVGTAFSLALSLTMAALYFILRGLTERRVGDTVLAALFLTAVSLLHLVVSAAAALALLGACAFTIAWSRFSREELIPLARSALLPLVIALLVSAPYLASVTGGVETSGNEHPSVRLSLWAAASVFVSCFGVFLLALVPGRRILRERPRESMFVLFWSVSLVALAFLVRLPLDNQRKFIFMLHLSLACFSGIAFYGLIDRFRNSPAAKRLLRMSLLLFLLPVNLIAFIGYAASPPEPAPGPSEMKTYEWISRNTPPDAVFLDSSARLDIPVLARRDLYFGKLSQAEAWGYSPEEVSRRLAARREVLSEQPMSESTLSALESLRRPLYVVLRRSEEAFPKIAAKLEAEPVFRRVFQNAAISLYLFEPPSRRASSSRTRPAFRSQV